MVRTRVQTNKKEPEVTADIPRGIHFIANMVEDVLEETGLPARPPAVLADNSRAHARNATVLTPAPITDIPRHNT